MTDPVHSTGTLGSPRHNRAEFKPRFGKGPQPAHSAATTLRRHAGEMFKLMIEVVKRAVTKPVGYWGGIREQMLEILKLCWWPLITSTTAFGYKEYRVEGEPIGVGRAVEQAVVITFAGSCVFNFVITARMLGLHPDMRVYR